MLLILVHCTGQTGLAYFTTKTFESIKLEFGVHIRTTFIYFIFIYLVHTAGPVWAQAGGAIQHIEHTQINSTKM